MYVHMYVIQHVLYGEHYEDDDDDACVYAICINSHLIITLLQT